MREQRPPPHPPTSRATKHKGRATCHWKGKLPSPFLVLAARRQHRARRDEERCTGQGLPALPEGCAPCSSPHPPGLPPLVPKAIVTCTLLVHLLFPRPGTPPRAPWTPGRCRSLTAPRLHSQHPWDRSCSPKSGIPRRLSSAPELGALHLSFPTSPKKPSAPPCPANCELPTHAAFLG